MKTGNVTGIVYERSIHKKLNLDNDKSEKGAVRGEDCAFFAVPESASAEISDLAALDGAEGMAIIAAQSQSVYSQPGCGRYAIFAAMNQAAAAGAGKAAGVLLRMICPKQMQEQELGKLVAQAQNAARQLGTEVVDVKASVSRAVSVPMVTATAVGMMNVELRQELGSGRNAAAQSDCLASGRKSSGSLAQIPAGSQIVMTKWAGLEGSAMLAQQCGARLAERYPSYLIEEASGFEQYFSILPEAAVAAQSGVSTSCAAAEGGIFRALWTLAERAGTGLEVDLKKIPIRQETVEICNHLDLNPYELMANGSFLCVTEHGGALVTELEKAGIPATVIGVVTDNNDRVIINGEERRFLEPAKEDEIYKIL